MKNKFKLLNIFLLSTIVIGFNAYANNLLEEDDEKVVSSEEKSDEATSKKPKGMPGKKKEYKTIEEFMEDGEYTTCLLYTSDAADEP